MPVARFQMPDGRIGRFEVPEGTSPEQATKLIGDHLSNQGAPEDPVKTAINKSPTAGLVDAGLALGSGAVAAPLAGLAGLITTVGAGPSKGADVVRSIQEGATYEPRTEIGKGLVKAVSYPFQKLADVADVAGGKTTDVAGPAAGTVVNTALQSVPLVLGRVGPAAGSAEALARTNALKLKNAPADAAVASAKEAGYSLPPSQANPTMWNKIVEGFAGKIKTAQDLSLKDQRVTNDLVRKGLGLSEDAPLTQQTLADLRKEAGKSYERVRSSGVVTTDPAYAQTLDKVAAPFERAAKDFPDAARNDILDAVKAARRDSFDASSAVDQISILRDKADTAYAAKDKKLGKAYKDIAGALEEQLGRHLETSGAPADALAGFRTARETIAKSYTVEKHLQPNGDVNARGLALDLKHKKPLTDELKTVAEFGTSFPKAAQLPEKIGGVPMSPLDHAFSLASIAGGVLSGHPSMALGAALPYTRPLLRKLLTSDAYQGAFVNPQTYGPSVMSKLQELQRPPAVPMLEMAEGQRQ